MAWMNMLYQTYKANEQMAGKSTEGIPLAPIAHSIANAQLEVTVNQSGTFIGAVVVDKENGKTVIPVTEASASRSSGDAPHPLCDTLSYVAGDFGQFLSDQKAAKKASEKFEKYITALKNWAVSPYSHLKVQAVYNYLSKQQLTQDLISNGILKQNEAGKLTEEKVSGTPPEKVLVRFRVLDDPPDAVWEASSLFDCYIQYYLSSQGGKEDICYLSGEPAGISVNHPKGIIAANYGAKLISANDTSNFTFRGRFYNAGEASAVSYEATQKAHSALTWLAARQGVALGTQDKRTYICWNPKGKPVAEIDFMGLEDDSEPRSYTEQQYKDRLKKALQGYRNQLDNNDDIVVIGLDAATTGRLSITYYNELRASDFYDRLQRWNTTCCWYFIKFSADKKPEYVVWTPFTKDIVNCAFGTERGNFLETSDKVMKEQSQRIYHCMLDNQPVPRDLVHALFIRASMPQAYSPANRRKILSVACALIAKYYNDRNEGVKVKMAIDYANTDRSYLFGRLLAVIEAAERYALEDDRETNAIRLQNTYVNHPMRTWKVLEERLNPYFQKMPKGKAASYKKIISEITEKIALSDAALLNRPLEEPYLIGYYLQRAEPKLSAAQESQNKEEQVQ